MTPKLRSTLSMLTGIVIVIILAMAFYTAVGAAVFEVRKHCRFIQYPISEPVFEGPNVVTETIIECGR